jgi:hypothetical protein
MDVSEAEIGTALARLLSRQYNLPIQSFGLEVSESASTTGIETQASPSVLVVGSQEESQSSVDIRVETDHPPINRSGVLPAERARFIIKDSLDNLMSSENVLLAREIAALSACVGAFLFWKKCRSKKSIVRKAENYPWPFSGLAKKPSTSLRKSLPRSL